MGSYIQPRQTDRRTDRQTDGQRHQQPKSTHHLSSLLASGFPVFMPCLALPRHLQTSYSTRCSRDWSRCTYPMSSIPTLEITPRHRGEEEPQVQRPGEVFVPVQYIAAGRNAMEDPGHTAHPVAFSLLRLQIPSDRR